MITRARAIQIATVLGVLACATLAYARPGGGDSFSGGSSSGGGGGGGFADLIVELLFELIGYLIVQNPRISVPVIGIGVIALIVYARPWRKPPTLASTEWNSEPARELPRALDLGQLRKLDLAFSQIVFEDFAFRLFSTAHRARHSAATLAEIAPYVSDAARASLARRAPVGVRVEQVVVGAMRVIALHLPVGSQPSRVRIGLEFEANVATAGHTDYVVERWVLARNASLQSRPRDRAHTFGCPCCGAPWQAKRSGTQVCGSCGQAVDNGRFDWFVESATLVDSQAQPPTLTKEVIERGTGLPTYRQSDVDRRFADLLLDDPALDKRAIEARIKLIFARLNAAWSNNELAPARGLVSDGLYDYLQYWVDAYRTQDLRNVLADMRVTRVQLARVTRDRAFDALTFRVWATGKDFVIRTTTGARVRGSKTHDRAYSEYWTIIRSAARQGAPSATPTCSHCGAPLQISQSGECEHCGAHVTAGEFDWVLSKIEQDEAYLG